MIRHVILCLALLCAPSFDVWAAQTTKNLQIRILTEPRKDDLPGILKKMRTIRVLVPYSRTIFFIDKGVEHGIAAGTFREFERYANRKLKTRRHPITVTMIPVTRQRLIESLLAGHGDIAAGNITITPERQALVDFSAPVYLDAREILVTEPNSPSIEKFEDLAGKEVAVKQSSSFHDSILTANIRLAAAGKTGITIRTLPEDLETEDIIDMVDAGILPMTIIDEHMGRLWAPTLKRLVLRPDIVFRESATIAYALRKGNPELRVLLDEFIQSRSLNNRPSAYAFQDYALRARQLLNNRASERHEQFEHVIALFRRYGERYGFNPLMLAAQGFQESGLDQDARSPSGAIGIMQLLPSTGAAMQVGDIREMEANIHAGTKYMDWLLMKYFPKSEFDDQNRALFAFAAYNVGPGRINRLREEARKAGFDPNKWFDNVELVVSRRIGIEPVRYVRNIFKYFVAYALDYEGEEKRRRVIDQLTPSQTD